jgi:hypothetical protein
MNTRLLAAAAALLLATAPDSRGADQVLFDFTGPTDAAAISKTDVTLEAIPGQGLRVETRTNSPWPGITLKAPQGVWDLTANGQVVVELSNPGTNKITVSCRVDNPGADGTRNCVTGNTELAPGKTGRIQVKLNRTSPGKLDGKLFGMRGYPVMKGGPGSLRPAEISQLLVFVSRSGQPVRFEVRRITAQGSHTPPTASVEDAQPFFPFIDTFGQYKHRDWPGKTHSVVELQSGLTRERALIQQDPGPAGWDKYGGWADGPKLPATGFFRTEKHQGKWWLVDPEGRLFFSHGVDCVRMRDVTPIEEREAWFDQFPGNDPALGEFLVGGAFALKGHYAGRTVKCFSFGEANLKRKYGAGWRTDSAAFVHDRLRHWGLNTIANWSDEAVRLLRRTPYTDSLGTGGAKKLEGSEGYWGKFPDVFDPGFEAAVRKSMAGRKEKSANDPWCIGYFSDNEMAWGDDLSLALAALLSPPEQAAKQAFLAVLRERHGTIEKLNAAWGTRHADWEALAQHRQAPDKARARGDLADFYTRTAERYFQTVRNIIRESAPKQLYLGCRFAWVNDRAAAAKYCDVVSYNLYRRSVADFEFNGGRDVPLIIGEFHFGALDRGMFHTGLVPVSNQRERAETYRDYVLGAARHPQFVGCHWFQFRDEPVTGRVYDEENYQIGFLDVCDTPYPELVEASRAAARKLYQP